MSDDQDIERRLRDRLQAANLPVAPTGLRVRLTELRARPEPARRGVSRGWWVALLPVAAILILGFSGLVGGGPPPSASPSPAASTAKLTLMTALGECGSIGGCVGYIALVPDGVTEVKETRLSQLGELRVTQGLPASIEPGRYQVRAHISFVSDDIAAGQPPAEFSGPVCTASLDAAPGTAIVVTVWFGPESCTVTVTATVLAPSGLTGLPATVDGLTVMTVSDVLAARAAGELSGQRVALRGYWSDGSSAHSCVPPDSPTGELEIYCHGGEWGITELDERIFTVDEHGYGTAAVGPSLTPWFPNDLDGVAALFSLPVVNGQRYPPVPIVIVGHFDDPRASDCRPDARQLCLDRLVVDRIAVFDIDAVPTPGISPSPTPFPSPAPSGLFGPEACAGDVPYTFIGWTTTAELRLEFERKGHVWAMVTRDPVLLGGGPQWNDDPNGSGRQFRPWGRLICIAEEGQRGAMEYGHVPGSAYWEWDDGTTTPMEP